MGKSLFILSVIIISLSFNLYFANNGKIIESALLLTTSSLMLSVLQLGTYLNKEKKTWAAADKNALEAQRLIQERLFGIFKYASWKKVYGYDEITANSIREAIETPMVWVLCIALFMLFFFSTGYSEFSFKNGISVIKLLFFGFLQTLFLSTAFLGMLAFANKKFKKG